MRFGVCLPGRFELPDSPAQNECAQVRAMVDGHRYIKETGYDYIEFGVANLTGLSDDDMARAEQYYNKGMLKVDACNCFIPRELPLTGESADFRAVEKYVRKAMTRMAAVGVETVVFGSGGARRIPDGFDRADALGQLDEFLTLAEKHARENGIILVVEPLNRKETNVFLTVTEAAATVRRLDLPNLKLLGDMYHTYAENEPACVFSDNADILRHVHVAQPETRKIPRLHPYLIECGEALSSSGYDGRVSIECGWDDFAKEMSEALPVMKKLFG